MNYIVLDLEWNSAYHKKQGRFVNEIIQIGAVKLDDKFNLVDTFLVYIKSEIVKKLNKRVIELTGITNEQIAGGSSFQDAVTKYNEWLGDERNVTLTWSDSDLYAIVENTRLFLKEGISFRIDGYVDLQSYIQGELRLKGHNLTNQISLGNAAALLGISTDNFDLHDAKDDARLSALLLKENFNNERFSKFIRLASDPSFYERLFFKSYYISNINDERVNKNHLKFTCPQCNKRLKRVNRWRYKNNWLRSEQSCDSCGIRYRGMVSLKQTYDKVIVKKRILPLVSNEAQNVTM